MTALVTTLGLQMIADRASGVAGAAGAIQSMSVDDSATALAAGTTNLQSPTNKQVNALDSTPTRSAQTVTHLMTVTAGQFNTFVIKRIFLHDDIAANVTNTSTTVVGGVDGLSLTKQSTFGLTITMKITYS